MIDGRGGAARRRFVVRTGGQPVAGLPKVQGASATNGFRRSRGPPTVATMLARTRNQRNLAREAAVAAEADELFNARAAALRANDAE